MKHKFLTTLIAAAAIIAAAPAADAQRHGGGYGHPHGGSYGNSHGHHPYVQPRQAHHANYIFISGYQRCGTPIYTERYLIRYDRRFNPIFGFRVVNHRPHHVRPAPRGYHVAPCPPLAPRGGTRGQISIRF